MKKLQSLERGDTTSNTRKTQNTSTLFGIRLGNDSEHARSRTLCWRARRFARAPTARRARALGAGTPSEAVVVGGGGGLLGIGTSKCWGGGAALQPGVRGSRAGAATARAASRRCVTPRPYISLSKCLTLSKTQCAKDIFEFFTFFFSFSPNFVTLQSRLIFRAKVIFFFLLFFFGKFGFGTQCFGRCDTRNPSKKVRRLPIKKFSNRRKYRSIEFLNVALKLKNIRRCDAL